MATVWLGNRSAVEVDYPEDEQRFGMLETMREFAALQIPADEAAALAGRHRDWMVHLALDAEAGF